MDVVASPVVFYFLLYFSDVASSQYWYNWKDVSRDRFLGNGYRDNVSSYQSNVVMPTNGIPDKRAKLKHRITDKLVKSKTGTVSRGDTFSHRLARLNNTSTTIIGPKSGRYLGFPFGYIYGLRNSLHFHLGTFTRLRTPLQFAHEILFPVKNYYPEFPHKLSLNALGYGQGRSLSFHDQNPISKKEIEYYEAVDRDRLRSRIERAMVYKDLESFFSKMGLPGYPCILRTICEIAFDPFENDFLGEFVNIIFTPSLGGRPEYIGEDMIYNSYVDAELHGRTSGDCHAKFSNCQNSIFSLLKTLLDDFYA